MAEALLKILHPHHVESFVATDTSPSKLYRVSCRAMVFSCNFYGAIVNHKGCFLFTHMQNDSLIRLIENVFGGKKGRFDPLTPKEHTHHRNTFMGALSENPRFSG